MNYKRIGSIILTVLLAGLYAMALVIALAGCTSSDDRYWSRVAQETGKLTKE